MTNTYPDDAMMEVKIYEEIRTTRCVLERILRVMDEGLFTDYQMEKFSGSVESRAVKRKYKTKPTDSCGYPEYVRANSE